MLAASKFLIAVYLCLCVPWILSAVFCLVDLGWFIAMVYLGQTLIGVFEILLCSVLLSEK